ncbi:hypothetical protein [Soonwooa sp.]|uniref:hypothetical protein n=1 Tax=Soonwooa sp. TaxID=1938592 RepID=UPI0028A6806F|nr:hypothetical protein [Soonwooa sp.]
MVNRKVLEKLSNQELNNYLKPHSRYVAEAIEMAFKILKQRQVIFEPSETERIKSLIKNRREEEIKSQEEKALEHKDSITENPDAFPLQSRFLVTSFALIFGTFSGSILLAYNCVRLKKTSSGIGVLIFGLIFTILQILAFPYLKMMSDHKFFSLRKSPEMLFSAIGFLMLFFVWSEVIPKKFEYRQDSLLVPFLVAAIMLALILWNYNNWFSSFLMHPMLQSLS